MSKFIKLLLVLAVLSGGAWAVYKYVPIKGLDQLGFSTKTEEPEGMSVKGSGGNSIRICSFNIQVLGQKKLDHPDVPRILAEVIRKFDLVAIQEIRSQQQDVMPRLQKLVNADGHKYDFVIGPRLGRTSSQEQYAYIFDTERIEVDPQTVYTVVDPGDRLHREPLVASFRVRGPPPEQAFTFTLVNVHTDPDSQELRQELDALDDVLRAVRADRPMEDDVIMLGDFNADHEHLGELGATPYATFAIAGMPTNTRKTEQYDNLVFHRQATAEWTGTSGVLDLMAEYKLTLEQALQVSDHLPVWAEFNVYEGGEGAPTVASRPRQPR